MDWLKLNSTWDSSYNLWGNLTCDWYAGFSIWNVALVASGYLKALYKDYKEIPFDDLVTEQVNNWLTDQLRYQLTGWIDQLIDSKFSDRCMNILAVCWTNCMPADLPGVDNCI